MRSNSVILRGFLTFWPHALILINDASNAFVDFGVSDIGAQLRQFDCLKIAERDWCTISSAIARGRSYPRSAAQSRLIVGIVTLGLSWSLYPRSLTI